MKSRHSKAAFGADAAVHRLRRAGRLPGGLKRLARAEQGLRGHAGPVVALAPSELALDDGHLEAAVGQVSGAVPPAGSGAEDDRVVVSAHARDVTAIFMDAGRLRDKSLHGLEMTGRS